MKLSKEKVFFELLQVAIGRKTELSMVPNEKQWMALYAMCKKQALLGIGFCGMQRLPMEQWPPRKVVLKWHSAASRIVEKNGELNEKCVEITKAMEKDGFRCCILKGQGNLANYPADLRMYRTCGDIDMWMWPKDSTKKVNMEVIEYVLSHTKPEKMKTIFDDMRLYHIDFHFFDNIVAEVHFMPNILNTPWYNKKFQQFCNEFKSKIVEHEGYWIPSIDFNVVYQLVHIYKHLFTEGIGLRQLLDYYMVLLSYKENADRLDLLRKEEIIQVLNSFGMGRFVGAVMWVLKEVFAIPDELLISKCDESAGRFLLDEIMIAGNFGKYDERNKGMESASKLQRFFMLTKRNWRFFTQYPSEVMWDPYTRASNVLWRKYKLWRV